jgi:copper chaperone CopZ
MRIEGLEDSLPGVRRVQASYKKQQVEVEYDETAIAEAEIAAAIRRLGYTVG